MKYIYKHLCVLKLVHYHRLKNDISNIYERLWDKNRKISMIVKHNENRKCRNRNLKSQKRFELFNYIYAI